MQEKLMNAIMLHQQGRLLEARAAYEAILKLYPQNSDTLHLLGVIAAQTGNTQRSIELISIAVTEKNLRAKLIVLPPIPAVASVIVNN